LEKKRKRRRSAWRTVAYRKRCVTCKKNFTPLVTGQDTSLPMQCPRGPRRCWQIRARGLRPLLPLSRSE
jgi:hypothetical protein